MPNPGPAQTTTPTLVPVVVDGSLLSAAQNTLANPPITPLQSYSTDAGFGTNFAGATGGFGAGIATVHHTLLAEGPFTAMRLGIFNFSTVAVQPAGMKAIVCSTTGIGAAPGVNGSNDRPNSDNNWVSVTWNAAGGGATAPSIPVALDADRPGIIFSDWMPVASLAPNVDQANNPRGLPWAMARVLYPVGGQNSYIDWQASAPMVANGHYLVTKFNSLDAVTTPSNLCTTAAGQTICFIEIRHASPVRSIMTIGDSIDLGQVATPTWHGYCHQGIHAGSNLGKPMMGFGLGVASTAMASWYTRLDNILRSGMSMPRVLLIPTDSPNDGGTDAAMMTVRKGVQDFAAYAISLKILPIFLSPIPAGVGLSNRSTDQYWLRQYAWFQDLSRQGWLTFDGAAVVGDPVNRFTAGAAYSGDWSGVHPGNTGHDALAIALGARLAALL